MSFVSAGTGSPGHLAGVLFNRVTHVTMIHVPYEASIWNGLLAPARTPPAIIAKLHENLVQVLQAPETRERFASVGADPVTSTPAAFGRFYVDEIAKWGKVVREAGVRID